MVSLEHYLILSAIIFSVGVVGALSKRNIITVLMSIELMLNAVNINLISYASFSDLGTDHASLGQVLIIFVITIAAAEFALAIAIILRLYRNRGSVNVDEIDLMKG